MLRVIYIFVALCGMQVLQLKATPERIISRVNDVVIYEISSELIEALETRNFVRAKEQIELLLPIMKTTLKEDQHLYKELKRSLKSNETTAEVVLLSEMNELLTKQELIYDKLHYLKNVSPAVYRVKGDDILKMVKEYVSLTKSIDAIQHKD